MTSYHLWRRQEGEVAWLAPWEISRLSQRWSGHRTGSSQPLRSPLIQKKEKRRGARGAGAGGEGRRRSRRKEEGEGEIHSRRMVNGTTSLLCSCGGSCGAAGSNGKIPPCRCSMSPATNYKTPCEKKRGFFK